MVGGVEGETVAPRGPTTISSKASSAKGTPAPSSTMFGLNLKRNSS
jgi:hypothetical protein